MKGKKRNDKTIQDTPSAINRKVSYNWFACNSFKINQQKNKLKVHTNTVHASVKKIVPKGTPKRPILRYNCT